MADPDKLPPKQWVRDNILKWGIEHPGISDKIPEIDYEKWELKIEGLVDKPLSINWEDFLKLPMIESISDFHCVETWSVLNQKWYGIPFNKLIDIVKPKSNAKYVWIESSDGYTTSLIIEEILDENNLLAVKLNGEYLSKEYGGPLRLVVPEKYAYKSPMYITRIEFTDKKELGYWEKRGYSDTADIWKNDRYALDRRKLKHSLD